MGTITAEIARAERNLSRVRQIAREFAAEAKQHFRGRLAGIFLYGSAARGDWTEQSDIDVLVLLDRLNTQDEEWIVRRALDHGLMKNGLLLQPLFMEAERFKKMRERELLFALEIEREGLPL